MVTQLNIINRALTEIAARQPVTGIPPLYDGSAAILAALELYQPGVETLLRQSDWEFARTTISLLPTGLTPPLQWTNEYFYPSDCLRVRQVVPQTWNIFDPYAVRWDVGEDIIMGHIPTTGYLIAFNGTDYAVGDTGIVNGGATPAKYIVLTIGAGGAVTGLSLTTGGAGFNIGVQTTSTSGVQPGIGAGLIVDVTATDNVQTKVIWTTEANATLVYTTADITENQWDALFTEQMVRYLGSMLAMPVGGRPDFSREMLGQAGGLGQAGRDRDS